MRLVRLDYSEEKTGSKIHYSEKFKKCISV